MIDLGLPSGTKWACCNVGADKPEVYGEYYAWAETETKSIYDWTTYQYSDSEGYCQNLGREIAGSQYDVAHVKWAGSWVMPSIEQIRELLYYCNYEWTTVNGVKGGKFSSKTNRGSIFMPAAGYPHYTGIGLSNAGMYAYYWSSSQFPSYIHQAYKLSFYPSGSAEGYEYRRCGYSVRPVSK